MKYNNILETIGQTPHLRINKLFPSDYEVWMKLERTNPGGSIKDRIAHAMVADAEKSGLLKKGGVILEPTSGNTGIGLAMVAAVKGYRIILVMPESMSVERRNILKAYGAELELTPREKGMKGSMEKALQMQAEIGDASAGTFKQLVMAAEACPAECIHPGDPLNPKEKGLDKLIKRAEPFN